MRIAVISDIHGQLVYFKKILKEIDFPEKIDKLIILGDCIDRGEKSIQTLLYVMDLKMRYNEKVVVLLGNHEEMLVSLIENFNQELLKIYYQNGGEITIKQYTKLDNDTQLQIYNFIKQLPVYYEYDKYIFVHAGVFPYCPITEQHRDNLLWIRDEFFCNKTGLDKIVIFGHTPTYYIYGKDKIYFDKMFRDKIGIDCGAARKKRLGCLIIDTEKNEYEEYYEDIQTITW